MFSKKSHKSQNKRSRVARFESLESRVVLDATFTQLFGVNNATNAIVFGPALDPNSVSFIHTFHITFLKDAGLPNLTYNINQLHADNLVHIPISGTVTGPSSSGFHGAQLDIVVNGNTANPAGKITSFSDLGTGQPGANGNDTISFMQGILLPPGETVDTIGLVFHNLGINETTPLIPLTNLAIDTTPPGITSVGPVPPMNTTPVDSVSVLLNDIITPSTFDFHALSLSRDGNNVPLDSSVHVTPVGNSTTNFTITGLAGFTNVVGNYTLIVNAATLVDPALNSGSGTKSVSFGEGTPVKAIPTLTPITTPRNTPVDSETVTFATAVDATSFSLNALSLTKNNVNVPLNSSLTISPATGTSTSFTISGLGSFTSTNGTYVLSVDGTKVKDTTNQPGTGTSQAGFVVDTIPPTISSVSISVPTTGSLDEVGVTLSKAITTSTFTPSLVTLTHAGMPIAVSHLTVTPNAGSRSSFVIAGLGPFTLASGNYVLTIDPSGFRDAAGNAGAGGPSPSAFIVPGPSVSAVGPVATPRNSSVDSVVVTFSGPVLASTYNASNITLTRGGVNVSLPGITTSPTTGTTSTITINGLAQYTTAPGVYLLSANVNNATDPFGTLLGGGGVNTFVVRSQPAKLASVTPASDYPQFPNPNPYFPLNSALVNFTSPIAPGSFTVAALSLTNGKTNIPLNPSVTITRLSSTQYQISNLAPFTGRGGLYTLTVSGSTLVDVFNQPVQGTVSATYNHIVGSRIGGPAVTRIQRTGVPNQPTNIVVTFNHPLDSASATNLANYALFTKPAHGPGQPITIGYASYNATTRQVTLYTSIGLAVRANYQLQVFGAVSSGVTDTSGRPLTGQLANPAGGGTYLGTFGGPGSVLSNKKK